VGWLKRGSTPKSRRDVSSARQMDAVALTFAEPIAPRSFARQLEYPAMGV